MLKKIFDVLFKTEFFTTKKTQVAGADWTVFSFSKKSFWEFMQKISEATGEKLPDESKAQVQKVLSKFKLTGGYSIDEALHIFDRFKLKFLMSEIEELKKFDINYDYAVSQVNAWINWKNPINSSNHPRLKNHFPRQTNNASSSG